MIPICSQRTGLFGVLPPRKDGAVGGYRHDDSIVLPVAFTQRMMPLVCIATAIRLFRGRYLKAEQPRLLPISIPKQLLTLQVLVRARTAILSRSRGDQARSGGGSFKIPKNTPPAHRSIWRCLVRSPRSVGPPDITTAIDVAETTVKSAEEILVETTVLIL
jgi:hypothetical protein